MNSLFTVVIAGKDHIDKIRDYNLFLRPFLEESNIKFLEWEHNDDGLVKLLHELSEYVADHPNWRAIIVTDDSAREKNNPFDRIPVEISKIDFSDLETRLHNLEEERIKDGDCVSDDEYAEFLKEKIEKQNLMRKQAFDMAAQQPLVRLVTNLCEQPHVKSVIPKIDLCETNLFEYEEYLLRQESQDEAIYKQETRKKIVESIMNRKGDEVVKFAYPTEIYCLALRTHKMEETDIESAWSEHMSIDYSKFYDWNMYYDRMRYLVFDILPVKHKNYPSDYLRFLSILIVMASNPIPAGAISSHRVYSINSEIDGDLLGKELGAYRGKLKVTYDKLEGSIKEIQEKVAAKISNKTIDALVCADSSIPVAFDIEIDRSGLFPKPKAHIVTDLPVPEASMWQKTYLHIQDTLHKVLKQPKRAIFKATEDLRTLSRVESEECRFLNQFQVNDIRNAIYDEEMKMAESDTINFCDASAYRERMEKAKKVVDSKLDTRIDKVKALAISGSAVLLLFISMLPLLFANSHDIRTRSTAITITVLVVVVFIIIAVVALFVLRLRMKRTLDKFNNTMRGINKEIDDGLEKASQYLGHVCSAMRGYSILNYGKEHISADNIQIGIYRKHQKDIKEKLDILHRTCGSLMPPEEENKKISEEPYDEDFKIPKSYPYEIPYINNLKNHISFVEEECRIYVPVDFIKKISVKMEEQYD